MNPHQIFDEDSINFTCNVKATSSSRLKLVNKGRTVVLLWDS